MTICVFDGAGVRPETVSARDYDHYVLLRTIEEIVRTGTLRHHDDVATMINSVWRP